MNTKKFTILHSNDIHGDFLAELEAGGGEKLGGLSLLSGYVNKVRQEEENVLYVIPGDMVQGSLIDAEYKGISTMELMNFLSPDVATLGNHEFDYGLPHLLFLEKMANFPIVNANLYIKGHGRRLMLPYKILEVDGLSILFTGIITEKIIDSLKQDPLVGSFVTLEEASQEVGRICNAYKNDDIDLTILLTHIGLDSDRELAKLLDPAWGVDMILGGHTHSYMEQPEEVNGVLIAQAGKGTDQVGRFDIVVDDDTNSVMKYEWQLVPLREGVAQPDEQLEAYIQEYKDEVDEKYGAVLTKLAVPATHPKREEETALGNLIADALASADSVDVMLVGSGSIRVESLGPVVTLKDFLACFPYDDTIARYEVSGEQLKGIFEYIMRKENRNSEGECYQVNRGVEVVYEDGKGVVSLKISGEEVADDEAYTVAMQGYHFNNCQSYLNISQEDLLARNHKVMTTSAQGVIEEFLRNNQNLKCAVEGRLVYR